MIRKHQAELLGHVACMPPDPMPNIALLGYTPGKLHHGHDVRVTLLKTNKDYDLVLTCLYMYKNKRWIEDILSYLNLNLESAVRTAQDRIHWKTMIRGPSIF